MSDNPHFPVEPLRLDEFWIVRDATGSAVLSCWADPDYADCLALYRALWIEKNPNFKCPHCGQIGIRMEEATPKHCGF